MGQVNPWNCLYLVLNVQPVLWFSFLLGLDATVLPEVNCFYFLLYYVERKNIVLFYSLLSVTLLRQSAVRFISLLKRTALSCLQSSYFKINVLTLLFLKMHSPERVMKKTARMECRNSTPQNLFWWDFFSSQVLYLKKKKVDSKIVCFVFFFFLLCLLGNMLFGFFYFLLKPRLFQIFFIKETDNLKILNKV